MRNTTQDRKQRPRPTAAAARKERAAPQIVLCAVTDDDHLQDVVATGRALERTDSFQARFVHVAAPAVRLRVPLGFAAGDTSPGAAPPLGSSLDDLGDRARDAGLELLQRAGIEADQSIVVVGEPAAEINRLAAAHDAALVVVGSHRKGAFTTALSGSVSHALARSGACPVLIARGRAVPCGGAPVVCGIRSTMSTPPKRRFVPVNWRSRWIAP